MLCQDEPNGEGADAVKRRDALRPGATSARGDTDLAHCAKFRGARAPNPEGALGKMSPATRLRRLLRQRDVFDVQVLLDAFEAAFATEARFLHAAERRGRVGDHAAVDADHPGLDAIGRAQRPVQ